ncbi:MAG: prepilin-type N-terminal cleavage/methylation domain-containing protein [Kiritimatiellia bacterium]
MRRKHSTIQPEPVVHRGRDLLRLASVLRRNQGFFRIAWRRILTSRRARGGVEQRKENPLRLGSCPFSLAPLGFTLVELLVVVAVIAILAGILLPVFSAAREKAKVTRVRCDLRQIELALEAYATDHDRYPPVRVSCNTDERDHWCQLPPELAIGGYLPRAKQKGLEAAMPDPFNTGHSYKYASICPYLLNGSLQSENFAMFIPDDFPICRSTNGRYRSDSDAPLAWVVWSLGPRQTREKALNPRAPVPSFTWYERTGDNGVIARFKPKDGPAFQTP